MPELLTMQDLANGHLDVKALGEAANGDENTIVTTRTGNTYPSAERAINIMFQNGGLPAEPFATKAKMEIEGASLADGKLAQVYNEEANNGLYVKSAGTWVKSSYDPLKMVDNYLENGIFINNAVEMSLFDRLYINSGNEQVQASPTSTNFKTFVGRVTPNAKYKIKFNDKANKFRVATLAKEPVNTVGYTAATLSFVDLESLNLKECVLLSGDAEWVIIYAGDTSAPLASVTVEPFALATKQPLLAAGLTEDLNGQQITDDSIGAKKTTFIKESRKDLVAVLRKDLIIYYEGLPNETPVIISAGSTGWSYEVDINPSDLVKITLPIAGRNRFRVVGVSTSAITSATPVLKNINMDNSATVVEFENDGTVNKLLIQVNTATSTEITVKPTISTLSYKIAGLSGASNKEIEQSATEYRLTFGKYANTVKGTLQGSEYPRLAAVKYEYAANTLPEPIGYLYTTPMPNQELLYSSGRPDDMEKIADWNSAITWNGAKEAAQYNQFITDDGDIVCVARGDLVSGEMGSPDGRQNPIIYPAGDYANPVVVDLGDRIKPTNWLLSTGISQIPEQDCFMFSEYTRPIHEKTHIWRVTKPYTNPDNWQIVAEFTIDRPNSGTGHREGNLKHMHTMSYDPWSGAVFSSTGDYNDGAKILMSKDFGLTWTVVAENDEPRCRVLNISFDETGAYWASDSQGAKHIFIYASRGADGYPDLSIANMQILHRFNTPDITAATYGTVRLTRPNGLLFLDRQDSVNETLPLELFFWSFDDKKMHKVANVEKIDVGLAGAARGFRSDAVTFYQPSTYPNITVGFNDFDSNKNYNAVAGNSLANMTFNLSLTLESYSKTDGAE